MDGSRHAPWKDDLWEEEQRRDEEIETANQTSGSSYVYLGVSAFSELTIPKAIEKWPRQHGISWTNERR